MPARVRSDPRPARVSARAKSRSSPAEAHRGAGDRRRGVPGSGSLTVPAPVRHAPVAKNDTTGTLLQANVAIDVLDNDTDADGNLDPSTLALVTLPGSGYKSITVSGGKIDVRVAVLYSGKIVFTYRICDTTGLCAQATRDRDVYRRALTDRSPGSALINVG